MEKGACYERSQSSAQGSEDPLIGDRGGFCLSDAPSPLARHEKLIPGIPQARPNSGPAPAPQVHMGSAQSSMIKLQNAAKLVNEALPGIPMGSDIHSDILKIATLFNKVMQNVPAAPGAQASSMIQQAREMAQQGPAQSALSKLFPQQPQSGAPSGAGAMPPPPQAGV